MTKLTYLHEPGVLSNLQRRYALNDIYVSFFAYLESCVCMIAAWVTLLSLISFHIDIGISVYSVAGAFHLNNLETAFRVSCVGLRHVYA